MKKRQRREKGREETRRQQPSAWNRDTRWLGSIVCGAHWSGRNEIRTGGTRYSNNNGRTLLNRRRFLRRRGLGVTCERKINDVCGCASPRDRDVTLATMMKGKKTWMNYRRESRKSHPPFAGFWSEFVCSVFRWRPSRMARWLINKKCRKVT